MAKGRNKNYFSGITRDTVMLALTSLFSDISTEMLYPILPIFLTQNLQAGGSIVGLIEGVAIATQNVIQGFSGWLSDRLQKRKRIALVGYSLSALSKPLIGFSVVWPEVLGARFLDRLGAGIRSAPRDALVAASVDEAHRGKAFGFEGVGDNLGAFLGPIVAVVLLFWLHVDIRSIFYYAFIPGLLAVMMILIVKESKVSIQAKAKLDTNPVSFPKAYWQYLFVTALFGIGNSSNSFLILQTRSIGVSLEVTIFIYALFNLMAALISYPAGFLSDKFGRKMVLFLSFFIFIVTYIGFALIHNIYMIGFLFILYGLYQGTFRAVGKAFATDFVPQKLRASSVGWYNTVVGLSGLVASIVAGLLWDKINHQSVFLYGALFAIFGTIALFFLGSDANRG